MSNKLREVRLRMNCKQWELTARSGVSAATLSAIERYDYKPSLATKQRIAAALNVSVESIWSNGVEDTLQDTLE